jgi:hypothetical protein
MHEAHVDDYRCPGVAQLGTFSATLNNETYVLVVTWKSQDVVFESVLYYYVVEFRVEPGDLFRP